MATVPAASRMPAFGSQVVKRKLPCWNSAPWVRWIWYHRSYSSDTWPCGGCSTLNDRRGGNRPALSVAKREELEKARATPQNQKNLAEGPCSQAPAPPRTRMKSGGAAHDTFSLEAT